MARDKTERIPQKPGKGGRSSGQAKPGSEGPIDNIFRDRNDGLDDSDDKTLNITSAWTEARLLVPPARPPDHRYDRQRRYCCRHDHWYSQYDGRWH